MYPLEVEILSAKRLECEAHEDRPPLKSGPRSYFEMEIIVKGDEGRKRMVAPDILEDHVTAQAILNFCGTRVFDKLPKLEAPSQFWYAGSICENEKGNLLVKVYS